MELHNGEISCSAIRKHTFKIDYKIKQWFVVDEGAHFELVQVIRCGFKPGSTERSIDH
jgi:hypothetical protein